MGFEGPEYYVEGLRPDPTRWRLWLYESLVVSVNHSLTHCCA